jgi:uncharacterized protein (DUF1501 family)
MIERRRFLGFMGAGAGVVVMPGLAVAQAATDRRFVFIIQRGAADGIGTLIPTGDPALSAARGALMVEGATKLDAMFSLHPSLSEVNVCAQRGAVRARGCFTLSGPIPF